MDFATKAKAWINENAPMLAVVYQNKYVGMAYDRFASFSPKEQKTILVGTFGGIVTLLFLYLFLSYLSLWGGSDKASGAYQMTNEIQNFQRTMREKNAQIQSIQGRSNVAAPGKLKQLLLENAKAAGISPRFAEIEEKADAPAGDDKMADIRMRQATVVLNRINLTQLKSFLSAVELGSSSLSVASVKITNDDKLRGYMKVELGVVAYILSGDGGNG